MRFGLDRTFNKHRWARRFREAVAAGDATWRETYMMFAFYNAAPFLNRHRHLPVVWRSLDDLTCAPEYSLATAQRHCHQLARAGFLLVLPSHDGPHTVHVLKFPHQMPADALSTSLDSLLHCFEHALFPDPDDIRWVADTLTTAFDDFSTR